MDASGHESTGQEVDTEVESKTGCLSGPSSMTTPILVKKPIGHIRPTLIQINFTKMLSTLKVWHHRIIIVEETKLLRVVITLSYATSITPKNEKMF